MANVVDIIAPAVLIGVGATAIMDLWALFLRRGFGMASLDLALLGRWIGHFPRGRFRHGHIGRYGAGLYASAWIWAIVAG